MAGRRAHDAVHHCSAWTKQSCRCQSTPDQLRVEANCSGLLAHSSECVLVLRLECATCLSGGMLLCAVRDRRHNPHSHLASQTQQQTESLQDECSEEIWCNPELKLGGASDQDLDNPAPECDRRCAWLAGHDSQRPS